MAALRSLLLVLLPLCSMGASSPAQDPPGAAIQGAQPAIEGTLLSFGELDERLTVPVAVGKSGPYNFIIDTGAERTVVSRELAGTLRLAPGSPVQLTSMTGRSRVETVIVPEFFIQSIGQRHTIQAPALEERHLGAAGLLGIDTLRDHQVAIDFETGQMTVGRSERRRKPVSTDPDEIVVVAKSQLGQLIVTDAFFGSTRIQVVLDTGSQVSMGNDALRRRVGARKIGMQPIELTSVTGGKLIADYTLVPGVRVGDVQFDQLPVAFAEVAPFRKFGLTHRPALLLGMDALRSFRHVEIDFPNRQVRFRMPRPSQPPPLLWRR